MYVHQYMPTFYTELINIQEKHYIAYIRLSLHYIPHI